MKSKCLMNHVISHRNVQLVSKLAVACVLFTFVVKAQELDFSLTPESPKVPSPFLATDDIEAGGLTNRIPGADLGVMATNDVTGLSYGQAEAADINTTYFIKRLAYSVDTNSTGSGAPIATDRALDGAAGDTFALDFVGLGMQRFVIRRPFNLKKAQTRNLTVKTNANDPEDDIDGLALFRETKYPVYTTFAPGSGFDPASIYIITNQFGPPQLFASSTNLGLLTGDVIDAFALGTVPFGGSPPTALNPNVVIWISLKSSSPSRGSAGDNILQAWPTPRGMVLGWPQLNLAASDEINALAVLDPAPAIGMTMTNGLPTVVWTGDGLQSSGSPDGPYTEVVGAANPLEVMPTDLQKFWRSYKSPPKLELVTNAPTTNELFAVWGSAPDDVYAVGNHGVVIHYDGEAWNIETNTPPTTNRLSCIYSAGPDELYFGGSDGLFRRDANGWSTNIGPGGVFGVTGITKTPDGNLHIVDAKHWMTFDGVTWRTNNLFYGPPYLSVQKEANLVFEDISYVVDGSGTVRVIPVGWDGIFPSGRQLAFNNAKFYSIWQGSISNVIAAGNVVVRFDGTGDATSAGNWQGMGGGTISTIEGIHGDSINNVYAVGNQNLLLPGAISYYNGNAENSWTSLQLTETRLHAVWVSGDFVVAVGQGIYMR